MPRRCQCCGSSERAAVDLALSEGVPGPVIAARHGVSIQSLSRHNRNHLRRSALALITATAQPAQGAPAIGDAAAAPTARLRELQTAVRAVAAVAASRSDAGLSLQAIKTEMNLVRVMAEIGDLDEVADLVKQSVTGGILVQTLARLARESPSAASRAALMLDEVIALGQVPVDSKDDITKVAQWMRDLTTTADTTEGAASAR